MRIASYKIQEPDYMEQYEKAMGNYKDGFSACPICGRLTNWDAACKKNRILRIVEGGGTITDELENPEFDGGADVGCWAVGATCWKKWLKATAEQGGTNVV